MSWIRTGTVTVTNGSVNVVGAGTLWSGTVNPGDTFYAADGRLYEVATVSTDTAMTLVTPYQGTTAAGALYAVYPTQDAIRVAAGQLSQLLQALQVNTMPAAVSPNSADKLLLNQAGVSRSITLGALGATIGAVTDVSLSQVDPGFAEDAAGGPTDEASFHFRRRATYSGGTPGFVNAGLKISTFIESSIGSGTSSAASFEWGFLSELDNYSTAGEMVAINGTARARAGAGPTWGGNFVIEDYSAGNPTSGKLGIEVDIDANGTDNNNARIGIDIAARRRGITGTAMEASFGIRFQNGGDAANSLFKTLVGCEPGTRATEGFATHAAVLTGAAFKMAQGQVLAFNATSTRQLTHNGGGYIFKTNIVSQWALNDDGSLVVNGTQILGGRNVGWTAGTGTLTSAKGAFNADTASLIDTARRLTALELAMRNHGLIGA